MNSSNINPNQPIKNGTNTADLQGRPESRSANNVVLGTDSSTKTQNGFAAIDKSTENSSVHGRDKTGKNFILGKYLVGAELLISIVLFAFLWKISLFPPKHMILIGGVAVFVFAVCFGMQFGNKTVKIIGAVLTSMIILALSYGSYQVYKLNSVMEEFAGATYKIDSMIVAVRKDDPAQNISDAKGYRFGYQSLLDVENTNTMISEVKSAIGEDITLISYDDVDALGQALLDKQIDAAIYNEAFNSVIEDSIEGYESNIRILYQHGVKTELKVEEQSVQKPFSVYISGIDAYGPISVNSRSDVNIIITVNPNTRKILLTSTPRDYFVPIPGVSKGIKDKLTHAGIYGVDKSMATLEELYGINIEYYIRINFTSLIKFIDAIGGVDVKSEVSFKKSGYYFEKGINHLDGEKALVFSRERKSFRTGDNQRGKNQQAIITAVIQKAMSPAILSNTNAILNSISGSFQTNMSQEEITYLIRKQLNEGGSWDIESINATGSGDMKKCYSGGSRALWVMQPNQKSVADISAKIKQVIEGKTTTPR